MLKVPDPALAVTVPDTGCVVVPVGSTRIGSDDVPYSTEPPEADFLSVTPMMFWVPAPVSMSKGFARAVLFHWVTFCDHGAPPWFAVTVPETGCVVVPVGSTRIGLDDVPPATAPPEAGSAMPQTVRF